MATIITASVLYNDIKSWRDVKTIRHGMNPHDGDHPAKIVSIIFLAQNNSNNYINKNIFKAHLQAIRQVNFIW